MLYEKTGKKIKLIIFDLDDTLAPVGKGISQDSMVLLKQIEDKGIAIAVCSGKPAFYLCGFLRQVGLKNPVLMGENGAVIQCGVGLPPEQFFVFPVSEATASHLAELKKRICEALPQVWYQPNLVGVTPFLKTEEEFRAVEQVLASSEDLLKGIEIYRHCDSFDFLPEGLNKRAGLQYAGKMLGIHPEEMLAVGNGYNDYPMFEISGYSLGVNVPDPDAVNENYRTIEEALSRILSLLDEKEK